MAKDSEHDTQALRSVETRQRLLEGGLIVLFWTFVSLLSIGQSAFDGGASSSLSADRIGHRAFENFLWLVVTPFVFWLVGRYRLDRDVWPRNLLFHAIAVVGVSIVVELLSQGLVPSRPRAFSASRMLAGLHFGNEVVIYVVILAAGFARDYFLRYQERKKEAATFKMQATEMQAQLAEARLAALRMQINPHFLFNTLHVISSFIDDDPRGAQRMITRLSKLLRYALDNTDVQEVPLGEEMKFLSNYLEIQQIRFEGRLEADVDIPRDLRNALVPSLILQPLVENAIKHGTSRVRGVGRITIRARREDQNLVLSVHDNGPGLDSSSAFEHETESEGVGLRNTHERLKNLYGNSGRLVLEPNQDGGLVAKIVIPYHTEKDLNTTAVLSEE